MSDSKPELHEILADKFANQADNDTFFRSENAELLGDVIAEYGPGPEAGYGYIGLAASDKTDGFWAKLQMKIRGYDKPTLGAAEDPKADHKLTEEVFRGLIVSARNNSQTREAKKLEALLNRNIDRNEKMDENRELIQAHPEIDQRELRASAITKSKMLFMVLGQAGLTKFGYEKRLRRHVAMGAVRLGTRLGEIGERQFSRKLPALIGRTALKASTKTE